MENNHGISRREGYNRDVINFTGKFRLECDPAFVVSQNYIHLQNLIQEVENLP